MNTTALTIAWAAIGEGSHRFRVSAVDSTGHWSPEAVFNLLVDTTAPVLGPLALSPGTVSSSSGTVTLTATVTDALSGLAGHPPLFKWCTSTDGTRAWTAALPMTSPDGQHWSAAINATWSSLAGKTLYAQIVAQDVAGNSVTSPEVSAPIGTAPMAPMMRLASLRVSPGVTVHLAGSSTYRANTHKAIRHLLSNLVFGYTGSQGLGAASDAIFQGTIPGVSGLVTIKTHWTGSISGIRALTDGVAQPFLDGLAIAAQPAVLTTAGTGHLDAPGAGPNAAPESAIPEVAMSDVFQESTDFYETRPRLVDTQVGIAPFVFVASHQAHGLGNITPLLAQELFRGAGKAPLSLFSGVVADRAVSVYATGRDPAAGSRTVITLETGADALGERMQQYRPLISGQAIRSLELYPVETINDALLTEGEGGEASEAQLAASLRLSGSDASGYLVAYLGANDAGAIAFSTSQASPYAAPYAGPAQPMTYNGVALSLSGVDPDGVAQINNSSAITSGQYTLWSYEHLYYSPAYTGPGQLVADKIATQLSLHDSTVAIPAMQVSRELDSPLITPN